MSLTKKNYQIVAEALQKMIEEGVLKPGDRLQTIDTLAIEYGVGRSTIREALSQLKAHGLIEARQGEGTFVKFAPANALQPLPPLVATNIEELKHLLQVRKVIEAGCAELAAKQHQATDLERLDAILQKMALSIHNEEMSRIYDIQFHMAMAKASRNPYMQQMMESISDAMNHTIRDSRNLWLYRQGESSAKLYQEHADIFQAIREQDAQKAREKVLLHLARVEQAMAYSEKPLSK